MRENTAPVEPDPDDERELDIEHPDLADPGSEDGTTELIAPEVFV